MAVFGMTGPTSQDPAISIKVLNWKKIDRLMKELPSEIRGKILGQVTLQGARILYWETVNQAPVGPTARLVESLVVKRMKNHEVSLKEEGSRVIVSRAKKVFYAHLVEFGHIWVIRRGGVTYASGHWSGNAFMMRAFNKKKDEASTVMLKSLRKKVIRKVNQERRRRGLDKVPRGYAA